MVVRRVRCRNRVLVSVGVVVILDPSSHDVVVSGRAGQEQLVWHGPAHFMLPSPGSGSLTVTLALVEVAAAVARGFLPLGTVGCLDKLLLAFDFFWFDFDFFDQNLSRLASSVAHHYFLYNYLESYWNYTKVSENSLKRRQPLHDTGTPTQQQLTINRRFRNWHIAWWIRLNWSTWGRKSENIQNFKFFKFSAIFCPKCLFFIHILSKLTSYPYAR